MEEPKGGVIDGVLLSTELRRCKVIWREWNNETKKYDCREAEGRFHGWGNDFVEFAEGPGNITVGIVELDDGRVVLGNADGVHFLDRKGGE